ncbi:putative ppe family protein ppe21 [Quercus suber]|uniref:Ppe family protein ppe21 n=1 Tax=Quercus suber TaxID=58331 RepID=A0AAW0KRE8_QUESU
MSCTLASSIEKPWPVTVQCDPDDNIGRRIRSSNEKRQNCGFELVAIEIVNRSVVAAEELSLLEEKTMFDAVETQGMQVSSIESLCLQDVQTAIKSGGTIVVCDLNLDKENVCNLDLDKENVCDLDLDEGNVCDLDLEEGNVCDLDLDEGNVCDLDLDKRNVCDLNLDKGNVYNLDLDKGNVCDQRILI